MDMDTDKNIHSAPCRVLSKVGNNTFAYKKKKHTHRFRTEKIYRTKLTTFDFSQHNAHGPR